MQHVPQPDLRPLRQPLQRGQLRAARRRRRRSSADIGAIGLRLAGGVLLAAGALLLLAAAGGVDDPEMTVAGLVLAIGGGALLVWSRVRGAASLRRDALLLAYAEANGMAYGARVLPDDKPGTLFRLGLLREATEVLRAPDGAEMGVWQFRTHPDGATQRWGYLELPVRPARGRALAIALDDGEAPGDSALLHGAQLARMQAETDGRPAVTAQTRHHQVSLLDDVLADRRLPPGLLDLLARSGRRLDVEAVGDRLMIAERGGWDLTEPGLHTLLHRIRSIVADSGVQPQVPSWGSESVLEPVASTPAGHRSRRRSLVAMLLWTCGSVAVALLGAWLLSLL